MAKGKRARQRLNVSTGGSGGAASAVTRNVVPTVNLTPQQVLAGRRAANRPARQMGISAAKTRAAQMKAAAPKATTAAGGAAAAAAPAAAATVAPNPAGKASGIMASLRKSAMYKYYKDAPKSKKAMMVGAGAIGMGALLGNRRNRGTSSGAQQGRYGY